MALINKSRNAVWRVWSGPYTVGGKKTKKRVGVTVAVTIRSDKLPNFSEGEFIQQVAELLTKHAAQHDPRL